METRDPLVLGANGAAATPRRWLSRRALAHTFGIIVALALAWLIVRAYQQPEFMLELSNLRLC